MLILIVALLSSCASRPDQRLLNTIVSAEPNTNIVSVYVATTRLRDENGIFTSERASALSYLRYDISIPSNHKPGTIEWPQLKPNAKTEFVTIGKRVLDRKAFEAEIGRQRNGKKPEILVLAHGYNTNFTESVFRMAQMTFDGGMQTVPVLFAWPSEGRVSGYVADKDAVTSSRDLFADLLSGLAAIPTQGPISIIGHSMGGWLTAETIRQLRLSGKDKVINRLHVILAAPDIDVDVFTSQIAVIGPLTPPMIVLISRDDVALKISEFLSTERQRLGRIDISDPRVDEATRKANIQIVDISSVEASDNFKHNRFVAVMSLYQEMSRQGDKRNIPDLRESGAYVFNAVGLTLSSPFLLAGKAVAGR